MTLDHHIYLNSVIYTRQGWIGLLKRLTGMQGLGYLLSLEEISLTFIHAQGRTFQFKVSQQGRPDWISIIASCVVVVGGCSSVCFNDWLEEEECGHYVRNYTSCPPSLPPSSLHTVILTDHIRPTILDQKQGNDVKAKPKNVFYFNDYKMVRYDDIRVKIQPGT